MTTAFSHLEGVTLLHFAFVSSSIDVARFLIRIGFHCADLTCLVALKKKSANPYSKLATSIHWHERKTHYDGKD
jgi:hypothetical protein